MPTYKIKIPVFLTAPLDNAYPTYDEMIAATRTVLEDYNNRPNENKVIVTYRKKFKQKTIKYVIADSMVISGVPSLLIRAEEFKTGLDDLYLQQQGHLQQEIQNTDQLGSTKNYALLFPQIRFDEDAHPINQWCAFVYADPSKDDADVKNTIKTILTRILPYKVKPVLRSSVAERLQEMNRVNQIKVSFCTVENQNNEDLRLREYNTEFHLKSNKEVVYQGVPVDLATQLLDDGDLEGFKKKTISVKVTDSLSYKYVYEENEETQASMLAALEENNCYEMDVPADDLAHIHEPIYVKRYLERIVNSFVRNE